MCLSGVAMPLTALFSSHSGKKNVIPGPVLALPGVAANTGFWLRCRKPDLQKPDAILAVQSKLCLATPLVDGCATVALTVIALAPGTPAARYFDVAGSIAAAIYLTASGALTLRAIAKEAAAIRSEEGR